MRGAPPFEVVSSFEQIPIQSEPCIILGMGKDALERFQKEKLIPKGRTVTSLRGQAYPIFGPTHQFMVTYNPGIVDIDYGKYVDVLCDTKLAMRMARTGKYEPDVGAYQWATSLSGLLKRVDELYAETGKPVKVALDLETTGFDPYGPGRYIVCLQASCEEGTGLAIHFPNQAAEEHWLTDMGNMLDLQQVLHSPKISLRGANLKFDLSWLHVRAKQSCSNFRFDTTAVGSLLDENRSNALNVHAKVYTTMGGYDDSFIAKIDKARMDLLKPDDRFLTYAAGDVDACLRVSNMQQKDLQQDRQLTNFYIRILHPALRAFEQIEQGGVLVDLEAYNELQAKLETDMARIVRESQEILGGRLVIRHAKSDAIGGLNLGKASLINDFMFSPAGLNLRPIMKTEKTGAPSTAKEHIEMFKDHPQAAPFVKLFLEYGDVSKTLSTYVIGFRKHIRSDGRFHPTYWLFAGDKDENEGGTSTGRLSCKDPAFQCMVGCSAVTTNYGIVPIKSVVEGHESGQRLKVLTHTGKWRDVVGVYRNGVRPVFKITTASCLTITCTDNHPVLTGDGFIKCGELKVGQKAFVQREGVDYGNGARLDRAAIRAVESSASSSRAAETAVAMPVLVRGFENCYGGFVEIGDDNLLRMLEVKEVDHPRAVGTGKSYPHLLGVEPHAAKVPQPEGQGVSELRRERGHCVQPVGVVRELPAGHGREAARTVTGSEGHKRELRAGQLPLGHGEYAGAQPAQLCMANPRRADPACERLGDEIRVEPCHPTGSHQAWVVGGEGFADARAAEEAGFVEELIVSIEPAGEEETYDLTIDQCHSFVAGGLVVHNTIPKHTKWAKAIRRCFPAPDGMLVLENDYSQGELKLMACVANEPTMIEAYRNNMDLHSVTSGRFAGYSYEQMMAMKKSDDKAQVAIFEATRQLGKAGNFGLIYGMGANGFRNYAEANYHVKLSLSEAEEFRDGFFNTYTELPKYHQQYKNFASKFGFVRNPLGRIRHLPLINSRRQEISSKAERQAINSPIQGALSDLMIWTIGLAHSRGYTKECPTFGNVHDAMYTYVPEDRAYEMAVRQTELMANLPFHEVDWEPQLQFTADGKLGRNMAELSDMAKWK